MAVTREVFGRMVLPNGTPFVGFEINFTVRPSQVTITEEWPYATVSVTTDENGDWSLPLGIGIKYQVVQYTSALVEFGGETYLQGNLYEIQVPAGEIPISIMELVLAGSPVPNPNPALVDIVLLRIPDLITPMVEDALVRGLSSIVLVSPDETHWRIRVDDSGILQIEAIVV